MKILKNLFRFSLLVLVVTVLSGVQLNYVNHMNTDLAVQSADFHPEGDVEGMWEPSGRLADFHPEGDVEGMWEPSGRLADFHPEGDVEGMWEPSGRLADFHPEG
ncbi:MAG: hypothetical protein DRI88_00985, partial [Bacteroidetes bacterium]